MLMLYFQNDEIDDGILIYKIWPIFWLGYVFKGVHNVQGLTASGLGFLFGHIRLHCANKTRKISPSHDYDMIFFNFTPWKLSFSA